MLFVIITCVSSIVLDCEYNLYQGWPINDLYECEVKGLQVVQDNVIVTGVSQNHQNGKSNANVEALRVNYQTMNYLPKNIENFFPNLKGIRVSNSTLLTWRRQDISPFPHLLFFYLDKNQILSIEGDLLNENPGVEYISFSENPMMHIGPNLFSPLKTVRKIHCNLCKCINKAATTLEDIDGMKLALAVNCPPTFEMIERTLLNGEPFKLKVEKQVDELTRTLTAEGEKINLSIISLNDRVKELEKIVRETNPCSCK